MLICYSSYWILWILSLHLLNVGIVDTDSACDIKGCHLLIFTESLVDKIIKSHLFVFFGLFCFEHGITYWLLSIVEYNYVEIKISYTCPRGKGLFFWPNSETTDFHMLQFLLDSMDFNIIFQYWDR